MLPQHWAIIIDAVTTLKQRWPISGIASLILSFGVMFPGQTVPSDCRRFAFSFDVWAWGVSRVSRWSGVPNRSTQVHIWQGVVGNTPYNDRMDMECYRYTSYSGTHCTESQRERIYFRPSLWRCYTPRHLQIPIKTRRWPNAGLMLAQRHGRWTIINSALGQRIVFAGIELEGEASNSKWLRSQLPAPLCGCDL